MQIVWARRQRRASGRVVLLRAKAVLAVAAAIHPARVRSRRGSAKFSPRSRPWPKYGVTGVRQQCPHLIGQESVKAVLEQPGYACRGGRRAHGELIRLRSFLVKLNEQLNPLESPKWWRMRPWVGNRGFGPACTDVPATTTRTATASTNLGRHSTTRSELSQWSPTAIATGIATARS